MLVPRTLVPVDAKVASIASATERIQDGPTRQAPAVVRKARQAGLAFRKELFAEAMLENSSTKPPRRVDMLVVSITSHALFLAALVLAPLYFTEVIDTYTPNEILLVTPRVSPPLLAAAAAAHWVPAPKKVLFPAGKLVAPRVVPNRIALTSEETSGTDLTVEIAPGAGIPGGIPGGQPGGVIGGVLSGASPTYVPQAPIDSAPKLPIRVGGEVKAPRLIFKTEPVYPDLAQQAKVSGAVVIDAVIDTQGNVVEMRPVSGTPILVFAAEEALRRWKYEPTIIGGQAFPVRLLVTINFQLKPKSTTPQSSGE